MKRVFAWIGAIIMSVYGLSTSLIFLSTEGLINIINKASQNSEYSTDEILNGGGQMITP